MKATKFDGKCGTCGTAVKAGTGSLEKKQNGWSVRCDLCTYRLPGFATSDMGRRLLHHPTFTGECTGCGCETNFGSKAWNKDDYDRAAWTWTCETCATVEAAEWATAQRAARPAKATRPARRERRYRMVNAEGTVVYVTGDDVHDARQDGFRGA